MLALGHVCVALGVIGAFLPVVPTTPFLLLATWAYGQSSPRLRAWLWTHPRYGKAIRGWHEHGLISRRAKVLSIGAMACSVGITAWLIGDMTVVAIQAGVLALVAAFIASRPEHPPAESVGTKPPPTSPAASPLVTPPER
nr:YbaN family protein [Rhodospirillum rubrum]